ncbi:ATP-binding protein [Pseudonocardia sp. RS11V-5]|uniref:ATP-binding protein n=1 Tax=Pseudonocardia terrae TaxID=2905831 RepID=UPI001E5F811C|nr:ATP-binding protein [Pseudonocardia terrae]MCE3554691.1 ATP-binding protein [Pseudonocardia terrae]
MTTARAEVFRLRVRGEQDVFVARQRGREVAALAGLEHQDQIRVATALSELSRELATLPGEVTITISLGAEPTPALVLTAEWAGGGGNPEDLEGVRAAARLTDGCEVRQADTGGSVRLIKRLPPGSGVDPDQAERIRSAVRESRPADALATLRSQNQDLLEALESLQARQEDLLRVNAELEETNRGVLALHAELSEELEETNRGVVALYAELDDASTRLREASEAKTRFWANVSHELRTPLNSVLGISRLLLDPEGGALDAEQRHQVELIRDAGAMLLSLVNELLDVAKAESGQIEAVIVPTDLGAVFDELRATLRPVAGAEVELVVERPEIDVVWTDPVLLGRILRNLVSNGLKFTERGEVRVRAGLDPGNGEVVVRVSDTGIGIPAEHQQRVFEEFYQVRGHLQAASGGTGLGLPYSRRLAAILGGSLGMESEPGRGTVLTLRLPARPAGEAAAGVVPLGRVLVVDDDPAVRALLRRIVEGFEGQVTEAGSGPEAQRALAAAVPDLVLLDLDIPAPTGSEVLAGMRAEPALAAVPVVVVTAAQLTDARRRDLGRTAVVVDKAQLSGPVLVAAVGAARDLVGRAP